MANVTELHVNGKDVALDADGERSLLNVLRDDLDLTGSKYGCGEGQCGACTVLLDGVPTRSCITAVGSVGRRKVTTIESLEQDGRLHPLQQAFLDVGAMQCGYCTSGMLMSGFALLQKKPNPSEDEIIRSMNGN
ncbi:MAG TPA: (2Fe-2S)-binding protein, partial [Verrucomicrobiae bacterium]|nr:(2Fe-2S)-binding protein [Verrucomicrobiae bacterium]